MNDLPRVHVHMTVSDLAKSRDFYTRLFGTAPVKEKPGYVKFLPAFGPLNLALSESRPAEGRGHVDHMGIQVESREVVLRELARANQDKFWVQDPDGVEWEVYVLNHDLESDAAACNTGATHLGGQAGLRVVSSGGCCSPA